MAKMADRTAESEKITINLGHVDLGHIDLMVQEGFYSNRTDFIRTANRSQLERHADAAKQAIERKRVSSGCGISTVRIWKQCVRPGRYSTSVCWAWPGSPTM